MHASLKIGGLTAGLLTKIDHMLGSDLKKQQQLQVCWNGFSVNVYQKIFKYNVCEEVKMLQNMCERLDIYHILTLRKFKFWYSAKLQ